MSDFHAVITNLVHEIPNWSLAVSSITGVDRDDVESWATGSAPLPHIQKTVVRVGETALRLEGICRARDYRAAYALCRIAGAGGCIPTEIARLPAPYHNLRTVFGWAWVLVRDHILDRTDIDVDWMFRRMSVPSLWTVWYDQESERYALNDESPRHLESVWGHRFWFIQTLPPLHLDVAMNWAARYLSLGQDDEILLRPEPQEPWGACAELG